MDFNECACSGKTLGRLVQPAIMGLLAQEPLHGYLLVQRLTEMTMFKCHPPDPTGVYRVLKSLENDGLVSSSWDLADSGPARRQFVLTKSGHSCLRRWVQTLEEYGQAIGDLLAAIKPPESGVRRAVG